MKKKIPTSNQEELTSTEHLHMILSEMEEDGIIQQYRDDSGEICFKLTDTAWEELNDE